jgi:hypothetical protein
MRTKQFMGDTEKPMRENGTLRLKSPQLYQLSYRPKNTEPLDIAAADDSGEWSTVPAVCPGLHRRQPTTVARFSTLVFWKAEPAAWGAS